MTELTSSANTITASTCSLCKKSRQIQPGIKLQKDVVDGKLRGMLCVRCARGIAAFPEPALMFQAILYLRGAL